jgi:TPR repeat protein
MRRPFLSFLLAVFAPQILHAGDDHPGLTAADQAYSAGQYETAAALYRRDAELGVVSAQLNLAFLFMDGEGVAQDYGQAASWFSRAAEQGSVEAQQNLGVLYRDGKGVTQDLVVAAKWFRLAGATADAASVETDLTREQKLELEKLVQEWKSRAVSPARR